MHDEVPIIDSTENITDVVAKISTYINKAVDAAYTYEQLRTTFAGQKLRPLISTLSEDCHHPALVAALLAARYVYGLTDGEDIDLNESRGLACELVAWQFLTFLSEKELIDYLLYELPEISGTEDAQTPTPRSNGAPTPRNNDADETSPLLESRSNHEYEHFRPPKRATFDSRPDSQVNFPDGTSETADGLSASLAGMNALEIAAIAEAKKFLSQKPVQKIVEGIWNGDIIFWESLSVHAVKKARTYNKRVADPFTRLRVPKYQKAFQIAFFISFLALYYAVLVERDPDHITGMEVLLYIWIAAFAYDEFGEMRDAGLKFYQTDFWSLWDLAIIVVGAAFFVTSQYRTHLRDMILVNTNSIF